MSLSLVFLLLGAAGLAGGFVLIRESPSVALRSAGAAIAASASIMFVVGLVNVLSGTA